MFLKALTCRRWGFLVFWCLIPVRIDNYLLSERLSMRIGITHMRKGDLALQFVR